MRNPSRHSVFGSTLVCTLVLCAINQAQAYELYSDESRHLNADMIAVFGQFNSRKNYDGTPGDLPGAKVLSNTA